MTKNCDLTILLVESGFMWWTSAYQTDGDCYLNQKTKIIDNAFKSLKTNIIETAAQNS